MFDWKIHIFKKGAKELPTGVPTYVVKWTARYGLYSSDCETKYQAFTNKREAEEFADSLRRAHNLLGNKGAGTKVDVKLTEPAKI